MKSHIADMNDWYLERRSYSEIRAGGGAVASGGTQAMWVNTSGKGTVVKGGRISTVLTTGSGAGEHLLARLVVGSTTLPLTFFPGGSATGTEKAVDFAIPDGWYVGGNNVPIGMHTTYATAAIRSTGYIMGDSIDVNITGTETPNRLKGDKANARKFSQSFKSASKSIVSGDTSATVWTPATGRKIKVKGFRAVGIVTSAWTPTAVGQIQLADAAIGTALLPIWTYPAAAVAAGTGFVVNHDLGDGVELAAVNNALLVGASGAITSGTLYMEIAVWGSEI